MSPLRIPSKNERRTQKVCVLYIRRNPADACKLPKITKPKIKPFEPEKIARFLKEAEKDDYCNLFTVAMFTDMRQESANRIQKFYENLSSDNPHKGKPKGNSRSTMQLLNKIS